MSAQPTTERSRPEQAGRSVRSAERLWALALSVGPALLLLLISFPELDLALRSPEIHFVVVLQCSLIALGLAAAVLNAARRHGDGRALMVGAAFLVIAAVFAIHAVATPNVLFTGRGAAVSWSGVLSVSLGGAILATSGMPIGQGLNDWLVRRFWLWLGLLGLAWLAYAVLMLAVIPPSAPAAAAPQPAHAHGAPAAAPLQPQELVGALGLGAYGLALSRHGRLYRERPSTAGLTLVGAIALLGESLLVQLLDNTYGLSFWLYHLLELAGCLALVAGVLLGLREGAPGAGLLESLLLPRTSARLRERYRSGLERLVEGLGQGKAGPAVAELRQSLGLSEAQLAVFEQAAAAVAEERQRRAQIEDLNEGLRQLERDREQLSMMIVHDLKNPITAIGGYLDILRIARPTPDQAELIAAALRSVAGLQGLVDDLLDIGRLEAGRLELRRTPVEPGALLGGCADALAVWAAQEGKLIGVEVAEGLPSPPADRRLLERLVVNLLSNAIKHTPTETRITLRADRGQGAAGEPVVLLEVADDGPGIPADRLGRIFEKYASFGDGGGQRGTGLGLAFCRLVAEAHGGRISALSAPGAGTVFRVELPAGECGGGGTGALEGGAPGQ